MKTWSLWLCMLSHLIFSPTSQARPLPSLYPAAPIDSQTSYLKLMKTPTILILREFRSVCQGSKTSIDFDQDQSVFDRLREIQKRPDVVKIRGLLVAVQSCVKAKSRKTLLEFLGVDMLLDQPLLLIRALAEENVPTDTVTALIRAEPEEVAGVECKTPECLEKRHQTFVKKKSAIESVRVRKEEEKTRRTLLSAIDSAMTN